MPAKPITFPSGGKNIDADLYQPTRTPNGGVVIVAHGSEALSKPWGTMLAGFANELAKLGFIALLPIYLPRTGLGLGVLEPQVVRPARDSGEIILTDAVTYAKTLSGVNAARIGLLGYSLGGHLCVRLRSMAKVVVSFFAPKLDGLGTGGNPALHAQIHHGEKDSLVPWPANAKAVAQAFVTDGVTPEVHDYPRAGHGFVGTAFGGTKADNAAAKASSKKRTLTFFKAHL